MKVLVVGGGIGGLAVAAFLEKHDFSVTLIEQAPEFKHIGFGMTIFSNARAVLRELGIDEAIAKESYQIPWIEMTDTSGHIIGQRVDFKKLHPFGEPVITVERASLHEALVKNLRTTDVRLGTKIQDLKLAKDHADVRFTNGQHEKFDLVIAADGIHSHLREEFIPKSGNRFYGWSLRFFWLPAHIPIPQGAICLSKEKTTLALYPLKDKCVGAIYEYNPKKINHPPVVLGEFMPYLSKHGWKQQDLDDLNAAAKLGHEYYDHLQYIPLGPWHKKRLVLLGDARHGLCPITGMGGGMALEDAFVLADELAKVDNAHIELALEKYALRRTPRIKDVQIFSKLSEQFYFINSSFSKKIRDKILIPFLPKNLFLARLHKILRASI